MESESRIAELENENNQLKEQLQSRVLLKHISSVCPAACFRKGRQETLRLSTLVNGRSKRDSKEK